MAGEILRTTLRAAGAAAAVVALVVAVGCTDNDGDPADLGAVKRDTLGPDRGLPDARPPYCPWPDRCRDMSFIGYCNKVSSFVSAPGYCPLNMVCGRCRYEIREAGPDLAGSDLPGSDLPGSDLPGAADLAPPDAAVPPDRGAPDAATPDAPATPDQSSPADKARAEVGPDL